MAWTVLTLFELERFHLIAAAVLSEMSFVAEHRDKIFLKHLECSGNSAATKGAGHVYDAPYVAERLARNYHPPVQRT